MIPSLLIGTALLLGSMITYAVASAFLLRLVALLVRYGYAGSSFWKNVFTMMLATLINTAGHLLQVALWALVFVLCGEFPSYDGSFYHSAVNYTALGYGDVIMSERWRLLGPFEALNGILLFGLSTAMMFAIMMRLFEYRLVQSPIAKHGVGRNSSEVHS